MAVLQSLLRRNSDSGKKYIFVTCAKTTGLQFKYQKNCKRCKIEMNQLLKTWT